MRRLNLFGKRSRPTRQPSWCSLQQNQIDQVAGANTASPLFPGSMLFNQIMLPLDTGCSRVDVQSFLPETLDPVFEYCSTYGQDCDVTGALVIDAGQTVAGKCIQAINRIIANMQSAGKIVLLGNESASLYDSLDTNKIIEVLAPECYSPSALHRIYRLAKHTVFIDTLRSMDAAHTGCRCSVIFSDKKLRSLAGDIWVRSLSCTENCVVCDVSGRALTVDTENDQYPFAVVDNDKAALAELCKQGPGGRSPELLQNDKQTHWLDNLTSASCQPVIRLPDNSANSIDLRDKKTAVVRKLVKLRQDPYAFLSDSKINLLRRTAKWFQPERKAG
jgi:hypothetical protein